MIFSLSPSPQLPTYLLISPTAVPAFLLPVLCVTFSTYRAPIVSICIYLAVSGLSRSSLKSYISALRHLQISLGLPDPATGEMPKLQGVMKGIKATQARSPSLSARKRLPITPPILHQICNYWESKGALFDYQMLWAAVTICFFGFLHSGEVTVPADTSFDVNAHITFDEISVDDVASPTLLKIRLKASKTDPFRKGVNVVVGKTGNKLCPVSAMLAFLAARGNHSGFLFHFHNGRLLTKSRFVEALRSVLAKLGFNPKELDTHFELELLQLQGLVA